MSTSRLYWRVNGNLILSSCLQNPVDGGPWQAAVHGVAKSQTRLSDFTFTFHFHALEKEMATHSSTLALKIPWTEELGADYYPWGCKELDTTEQLSMHTKFTYDIQAQYLPTKVCPVNAMDFPVVMYGCESWTVKKAEHRRIDVFKLWCWRRLLRVPWTERKSNQSILKEINPGISLEGMMLKLKLQYFGHLM